MGGNSGEINQDPNAAISQVLLTNHANSPDSGKYWLITTAFQGALSPTGNRGQIAIEYNPTANARVFTRSIFQTVWTDWKQMLDADTKLDNLAVPDDNTDLDASTSKHGLLKKLGGGTANFLRADGSWVAPGGGIENATAGNYLEGSAATERSTTSTSYIKVKQIYIPRDGTYRIKFGLKRSGLAIAVYGRIYKNGAAYGTQRSTTSTSYTTYSQDLSFSKGDLLQLYYKTGHSSTTAYVNNFKVYTGNPIRPGIGLD